MSSAGLYADQMQLTVNDNQRNFGYSEKEQPANLFGEIYRDSLWAPDEGIRIGKFSSNQLILFRSLLDSYKDHFPDHYIRSIANNLEYETTKFFFMGETESNGKHFYRIKNEVEMIECENYGGHTHHLWRNKNDFGLAVMKQ